MRWVLNESAMNDYAFINYVFKNRFALTDIRLCSCDNITDKGIEILSCLIPGLQNLCIVKCGNITTLSEAVIKTNCRICGITFKHEETEV
jgi:hypothetical protein